MAYITDGKDDGTLRTFSTGATRDTNEGKLEPWGFASPLAELEYSRYMNKHRIQSDGQLRDSDNWKRGIPILAFYHSLSRHILAFRLLMEQEDGPVPDNEIIDVLCAVKFNVDGLIHEYAKKKGVQKV